MSINSRRGLATIVSAGALFALAACGSAAPTESAAPTTTAATTAAAPATPSPTIATRPTTSSAPATSSKADADLKIYVSSTEDPVMAGTQIMPGKWKMVSKPSSGSQWAMVSIIDGKSIGTKVTAWDQGSLVAIANNQTRTFSDPTFLSQMLGYDAPITLKVGDTLIPDASSPDWTWVGA